MISRIRSTLGVELSIQALFAHPTVEQLAAHLNHAPTTERPTLQAQPRPAHTPLSYAQQGLWFLSQLENTSVNYHVPFGIWLDGDLDVAALQAALGDVVARHESLRTCFPVSGGLPYQHVYAPDPPVLEVQDCAESDVLAAAARVTGEAFDLSTDPPLRVATRRLSRGLA